MKSRLNQHLADHAAAGHLQVGTYRDRDLPGFALAVRHKSAVWLVMTKVRGHQTTRKIGDVRKLPADEARERARLTRKRLRDPREQIPDSTSKQRSDTSEPTLDTLIEDWIASGCPDPSGRIPAASTQRFYIRLARNAIPSRIQVNKVAYLGPDDMRRIQASANQAPVKANRIKTMMFRIMAHAQRRGWRKAENPATKLPSHPEKKRSGRTDDATPCPQDADDRGDSGDSDDLAA